MKPKSQQRTAAVRGTVLDAVALAENTVFMKVKRAFSPSTINFEEYCIINRIVIDLYKASKITKLESTHKGKGLISNVRVAKNNPTKLRVVVETRDIVLYQGMTIPASSDQDFRLVIDLKNMYEGSKKIATSSINQSKMVIAIDPGHGGKDPGAAGKNIKEKHLVLKIAKRLVSLINAEKNMSAFF